MLKDHRVSCDNCGAFDFGYSSYFDEYECKSCAWIVRDDQKIAILEKRFKKAALEELIAPSHKHAADEQAQSKDDQTQKAVMTHGQSPFRIAKEIMTRMVKYDSTIHVQDDKDIAVPENRLKKTTTEELSAPAHKKVADEQAQVEIDQVQVKPAAFGKEITPEKLEYGIHDLRKAVIWSEILAPPLALRDK